MDSVTLIVTALATGAVAGLKPTADRVVEVAYEELKGLLQRRFSQVDVTLLEQQPASKSRQDAVAEDLARAGADMDSDVLRSAQELLKLIESRAPEAAAAIGTDLEWLRAGGSINIEDMVASGTGNRGQGGLEQLLQRIQERCWRKGDAASVSTLLELLKAEKPSVRSKAAFALGRIGESASPVVPALLDLLKDEDSDVRLAAVGALGWIGDAVVIPALQERLEDESIYVRLRAADALKDMKRRGTS
jgi:HEAT repeats